MQLFSVTVLCSINKSFCRRILLGSRNLRLETLKLEAGSWKLEARNSKLETRNSKLETRNSKLEARSSKLEARSSKLEPRNSSFEKSKTSRIEFRVSSRDCQLTFDRYCKWLLNCDLKVDDFSLFQSFVYTPLQSYLIKSQSEFRRLLRSS